MMELRKGAGSALLALAATISMWGTAESAQAAPTTFSVGDDMGRDLVSFSSSAPIELVEGRTGKIKGEVVLDDSLDLSKKPIKARFTVDLASIDTGIEMRNQHMRDNFLESSKYPEALFEVSGITGKAAVLKPGTTTIVTARGTFTVHGKSVEKEIPVQVTYFGPCDEAQKKTLACDAIIVRATFPVKLEDHEIKRPEMLFQKLADTVYVKVSATARRTKDGIKTSAR